MDYFAGHMVLCGGQFYFQIHPNPKNVLFKRRKVFTKIWFCFWRDGDFGVNPHEMEAWVCVLRESDETK